MQFFLCCFVCFVYSNLESETAVFAAIALSMSDCHNSVVLQSLKKSRFYGHTTLSSVVWEIISTCLHSFFIPAMHNLFWPRATSRFHKPFRDQTSATTQPLSDKCVQKFTNMTCAVKHNVNRRYREIHSLLFYHYNCDTFSNDYIRSDTNSKVVHTYNFLQHPNNLKPKGQDTKST